MTWSSSMEMSSPVGRPQDGAARGADLLSRSRVDPRDLRAAFRSHPEGVTIITTRDEFGNLWGMTATAVMSLSLDPPLLALGINGRSPLLGPMTAGAHFIVHFLAAHQEELATRFATAVEDKFEGSAYRFGRSGCARLEGALASLECTLFAVHPGGDHHLLVAEVVDVTRAAEPGDSLVFFEGQMGPVRAPASDPN